MTDQTINPGDWCVMRSTWGGGRPTKLQPVRVGEKKLFPETDSARGSRFRSDVFFVVATEAEADKAIQLITDAQAELRDKENRARNLYASRLAEVKSLFDRKEETPDA
jgi:hypothetical protein